MEVRKSGEIILSRQVRNNRNFKNNVMREYKVDRRKFERRKHLGQFDKNCLSETDLDKILAIC